MKATVTALLAFVCASLVAAQVQLPADDPNTPTFARVCGNCHTPDRIVATRRSRDQWGEVIDNMITRGAKGSDDDFGVVMEYLVAHFGRVNVNRATAGEIAEVVPLQTDTAQKIVDYRRDHGPFGDFDALAAVPGIDVATLRAYQDALTF